jgi:hypothetical protein
MIRTPSQRGTHRYGEERASLTVEGARTPSKAKQQPLGSPIVAMRPLDCAVRPVSETKTPADRVAQLWASISVAVVLLTLIGILAYQRQHLLSALDFAIAVFAFVEARFKKRLARFIDNTNVTLVMVGVLVLLKRFLCRPLEPARGSDTCL